MKSFLGVLAIIAAVCAGVVGLVVYVEAHTPNSTSGITETEPGVVRIVPGETAVFHQTVGKSGYTWSITYDGVNTVHLDREHSWLSSYEDEHKVVTVENGATTTVEFGWLMATIDVRVEHGTAYVLYDPGFWSSWHYRPYKG